MSERQRNDEAYIERDSWREDVPCGLGFTTSRGMHTCMYTHTTFPISAGCGRGCLEPAASAWYMTYFKTILPLLVMVKNPSLPLSRVISHIRIPSLAVSLHVLISCCNFPFQFSSLSRSAFSSLLCRLLVPPLFSLPAVTQSHVDYSEERSVRHRTQAMGRDEGVRGRKQKHENRHMRRGYGGD